jgi:flagellin
MSTINTNVNSMIAQRVLGQQSQQLNNTLQKLSTGLRINSGKDDPSGLIASENLRSQETAINAAIGNAERADSMINVAEGGLKEINSQLMELQSLVSKSANDAGLSQSEKEANQQEVDAILSSIDRIASTTNFQGQKLLNGNFDFATTNEDSGVESVNITEGSIGEGGTTVNADVTASAQRGGLYLSTAGNLDLSGSGNDAAADTKFTIEVSGTKGSKEFSFSSGTTTSAVAAQINNFSDALGVSATNSANGGNEGVRIDSQGFGSNEFVAVTVKDAGDINNGNSNIGLYNMSGSNTASAGSKINTFDSIVDSTKQDSGQDVGVLINGQSVSNTDGREISLNLDNLTGTITLKEGGGGGINAQNITNGKLFDVSGGARFNIGAEVNSNNRVEMSMGNVQTRKLGETDVGGSTKALDALGSTGSLNLTDGDMGDAQDVVNNAISQVSELRGRLGSVQKNTLQPTINNLNVAKENTAAAESAIRDTDFANATSELTRAQILQQSAQNSLSIANNQPQNVLSLLGG